MRVVLRGAEGTDASVEVPDGDASGLLGRSICGLQTAYLHKGKRVREGLLSEQGIGPGDTLVLDLHCVLGVGEHADADEIKTSYRRMVRRFHPDRSGRADSEPFQTIRAAYRTLADPRARDRHYFVAERVERFKERTAARPFLSNGLPPPDLIDEMLGRLRSDSFGAVEDASARGCAPPSGAPLAFRAASPTVAAPVVAPPPAPQVDAPAGAPSPLASSTPVRGPRRSARLASLRPAPLKAHMPPSPPSERTSKGARARRVKQQPRRSARLVAIKKRGTTVKSAPRM